MSTSSPTQQLAIHGGKPVRSAPWPKRMLFGQEEKAAVVALFDRAMQEGHQVLGYNGPQEEGYTREFADFMGGGYADGVNSGTSAVYVALRALDIEPYREVIVPPVTDPGGVMPVPLLNCIPVASDSAPGSYDVGAEQIAACMTDRTAAIIVTHIAGIPADMEPIVALAKKHAIPVIEDCAQAHGALYKGKRVGSWGAIGCFSTMFGKHHATGGQGGLVFTRDEDLYWRIRRASDRGKPFGLEGQTDNVFASQNLNMDELHAAIGRVQLGKLPDILRRRRDTANAVGERCNRELRAVRLVDDPPGSESVYWFLLFHLDLDRIAVSKQEFAQAVKAEGVPVESGYAFVQQESAWWRNKAAFGSSQIPWSCASVAPELELPNIHTTEACHIRAMFHEDWTEREIEDLVQALFKVESVYLK